MLPPPGLILPFVKGTGFFDDAFVFLRQGLTHSVAKADLELAMLLPQSLSAVLQVCFTVLGSQGRLPLS